MSNTNSHNFIGPIRAFVQKPFASSKSDFTFNVGKNDSDGKPMCQWVATNDPNPGSSAYSGLGGIVELGRSSGIGGAVNIATEGIRQLSLNSDGDSMDDSNYTETRYAPDGMTIFNIKDGVKTTALAFNEGGMSGIDSLVVAPPDASNSTLAISIQPDVFSAPNNTTLNLFRSGLIEIMSNQALTDFIFNIKDTADTTDFFSIRKNGILNWIDAGPISFGPTATTTMALSTSNDLSTNDVTLLAAGIQMGATQTKLTNYTVSIPVLLVSTLNNFTGPVTTVAQKTVRIGDQVRITFQQALLHITTNTIQANFLLTSLPVAFATSNDAIRLTGSVEGQTSNKISTNLFGEKFTPTTVKCFFDLLGFTDGELIIMLLTLEYTVEIV